MSRTDASYSAQQLRTFAEHLRAHPVDALRLHTPARLAEHIEIVCDELRRTEALVRAGRDLRVAIANIVNLIGEVDDG